eukprot:15459139-Alexandrium_andersonii.AAC.2
MCIRDSQITDGRVGSLCQRALAGLHADKPPRKRGLSLRQSVYRPSDFRQVRGHVTAPLL